MAVDWEADLTKIEIGDILSNSWGCGMTINDYCKVVDKSASGKTLTCAMVGTKINDDSGLGGGNSEPDSENITSEPFKLQVRRYKNNPESKPYIVGSYPFCNGSKHKGHFNKHAGGTDYYNTWD